MGPRLLLVDDDEHTRFIVKRTLARLGGGLAVREAPSGEEAIRLLDAEAFDVVLSDFSMAGKDGVDVLCHALDRQPGARRVLMSGTLPEALGRMEGRGCVDHAFEKPTAFAAWATALRAALA